MMASRWNPYLEMNRLRDQMDQLFGRWDGGGGADQHDGVYPLLNAWEDESNLYVEAELPGFELAELEIYVTGGNQLAIKGERKDSHVENGIWHRRERAFGSFSRMVELPRPVDSNKVSAEFKDGVLTVTLPKAEEVRPRRIQVKGT